MDKYIYKIEQDDMNTLKELKIKEYFPIQDDLNNKLIINKLTFNDSKLFIETVYLKVIKIEENKLYLELPESHILLFNNLDDICSELLEKNINGNSDLDMLKYLYSENKINFENILYKSILEEDTKILKINIFSTTTIKLGNNIVSIKEIKSNDMIGVVLGLDYISLLMDVESLIARTKLYCYFINIYKPPVYNPEPREVINEWEFTSKIKSENIFIKTQISESDNFDVKTDFNYIPDTGIDENKLNIEDNKINETILNSETSSVVNFLEEHKNESNIELSNLKDITIIDVISNNDELSKVEPVIKPKIEKKKRTTNKKIEIINTKEQITKPNNRRNKKN